MKRKLSIKELRLLIYLRKRGVTDTICWSIFFLLTIGFCAVKNESFITWQNLFSELIRDSLIYTAIMMIPVYLNLSVLKRHLLDSNFTTYFRYSLYIISTILISFIMAQCIEFFAQQFPDLLKNKEKMLVNMLVVFGLQLIATGLIYLRELQEITREFHSAEFLKMKAREEMKAMEHQLHKTLASTALNHIKVGTKHKYEIIPFDDVLYIQGNGNDACIYRVSCKKPYDVFFGKLKDFIKILPKSQFIQVHKSFIINKTKVTSRISNKFFLEGVEDYIPIGGDTFKSIIESDDYLGFNIEERG